MGKYCSNCGKEISGNAKFCIGCGKEIIAEKAPEQVPENKIPAQPVVAKAEEIPAPAPAEKPADKTTSGENAANNRDAAPPKYDYLKPQYFEARDYGYKAKEYSYDAEKFKQPPEYYAPSSSETLTVGQCLLVFFVGLIPIVGLILQLVWAFNSTTPKSKQNLCRAILIIKLIAVVIFAIWLLVFLAAFAANGGNWGNWNNFYPPNLYF